MQNKLDQYFINPDLEFKCSDLINSDINYICSVCKNEYKLINLCDHSRDIILRRSYDLVMCHICCILSETWNNINFGIDN